MNKTQEQMFRDATKKSADRDKTFMDMMRTNPITKQEFEKLVKKNPKMWERYRKFFESKSSVVQLVAHLVGAGHEDLADELVEVTAGSPKAARFKDHINNIGGSFEDIRRELLEIDSLLKDGGADYKYVKFFAEVMKNLQKFDWRPRTKDMYELDEQLNRGAPLDYLVVGIDGKSKTFDKLDAMIKWLKSKGIKQKGVHKRPGTRPILQGQPEFSGLLGPMYGGPATVRYESQEAYNILSR
jgi:hypothetical protein